MDPFTLATGSAGLLSTGITISHGLISYCRSYRSREENLSGLQHNAERLKTQLQLLENRHQADSLVDQDSRNVINECISTCNKCLVELEQLSKKYSPPSTGSTLRGKSQAFSRRLRYPFQKEKFESFRQQIHELNILLLFYFTVLNHDLTATVRDESRAQNKDLASGIFDGAEVIKSRIDAVAPDLSRMLETEFANTRDAMSLGFDNLQSMLERRITSTPETSLHPGPHAEAGSSGMVTNSTLEGQLDNISPSQAAHLAPQRNGVSSRTAEAQTLVSLDPRDCNCYTSSRRPHNRRKPCFHNNMQRNRKTLSGQLTVFSYLFQVRVAIEYSQRAFLSDLQIQPNLTIRATVSWDSPAFTLVLDIVQSIPVISPPTGEELQIQVRNCLNELQGLYLSGQAWPTDVDPEGYNLLGVVSMVDDIASLEPNVANTYSEFLEGLVHLGVPLSQGEPEINIWMYYFVVNDSFGVNQARYANMMRTVMKTLANLGADLWDTATTTMWNPGAYILRTLSQDMLGQPYSIGYPELSYALLQKSEAKVRRLLSGTCNEDLVHILQERGPWGQTALHVSTFWPQGMHLIFELAGESVEDVINIEDDDGKTALDYAVNLREFDSVIILVIHGNVEMDIEDASNLFKLQDSRPSQETLDFFAHLLVDGRRHLYHLAAPILRFKKRQKRRTPSFNLDPILQESAFIVVKLLAAMGFGIPIGFRHVQPGSIYHSLYSPSVELLEAIYKAGFSRTNVSYLGFHPLMTMKMHQPLRTCAFGPLEKICDDTTALLEVIIWFVDHGADLGRPIPRAAIIGSLEYHDEDRQFRMIHQLSEELGHFMGAPLAETDNVEQPLTSMLCEMVTSPDVDPCTCLCSPGGCTAISVFARKSHDNHSLRKNEAVRVIASLDPDSEDTPRVVSGLLRLTIFEQLGMRHTCCKYIHEGRGRYNRGEMIMAGEYQILELKDPEEIAELQEEDKHLSERLEELVLEFDEQYRSLGKPFIEFFTEYVEPRMDEIDAEEESLSPEEEEAIRNTGVILHDTRDQVEREFSCDDMTDIAQA